MFSGEDVVTEKVPAEATSEPAPEPSVSEIGESLLKEGAEADKQIEEAEAQEAGAVAEPAPQPQREPPPPPPPQRVQDTPEWRQFQAAKDREVAQERRQREEMQARLEARELEVEIEAFRREKRDQLIAQNADPQQAEVIANANAQERRARLQSEKQSERFQRATAERYVQSERVAAYQLAQTFKNEGLTDEDVGALMEMASPEAIITGAMHAEKFVRHAQYLASLRKQANGATSVKQSQVKPGQIVGAGVTQPVSRPTEAEMFRRSKEGDDSPEVRRFMDAYMNQRSY